MSVPPCNTRGSLWLPRSNQPYFANIKQVLLHKKSDSEDPNSGDPAACAAGHAPEHSYGENCKKNVFGTCIIDNII